MKVLMVLASFGMLVAAAPQYSSSQYGAPGPVQGGGQSGGYGAPQQQQQQQGGYQQSAPQEQRIHKHVYVHVAPEEPEAPRYRAPKAPQVPEKHYKILFIRAPEEKYEAPDIPDLPPAPEQKTLVYVLLKKPDATQAIQIPTPAPTKPSKPEVYFIRYKSPEAPNNAYGAPQQGGNPIGPAPSSQYGSPQQQAPAGQYGAPGGGQY